MQHAAAVILFASASGYFEGGEHPQEHRVSAAADRCVAIAGGNTVGTPWTGCVVEELLEEQAAAERAGSDDYFPIVPHQLDPFGPDRSSSVRSSHPGRAQSELLKNLLRNYSCDHADAGSQPVRSLTWEYRARDPCASSSGGGGSGTSGLPFIHKPGFLPAGDDLPLRAAEGPLTEEAAMRACLSSKECAGFTFATSGPRGPGEKHAVHFKSAAETVTPNDGWHTFKRKARGLDCRPGKRAPPPPAERYTVDVLRESPPVYVVRDFVTAAECEHMLNITVPKMERSVVFGGGQGGQFSRHRQSYSVNMNPDYDDESNVVTRVVRRKFAFGREVAEYEDLVEGEGQEPLNSVYYKDWEDQYRPHCDGECYGGRYVRGGRIATSLTYCEVAARGGYTLFSRSNLKVVPRLRDMLFFGYKLKPDVEGGPPRMDDGKTEHTGCPLREGTKWIANTSQSRARCTDPSAFRAPCTTNAAAALCVCHRLRCGTARA